MTRPSSLTSLALLSIPFIIATPTPQTTAIAQDGGKMRMDQPISKTPGSMGSGMQGMKKSKMSVQEIKKEFRMVDKNHDGYIDLNETVMHEGGNKDLGKLHFKDADRNKHGRIDLSEWIRHHQTSSLHKTGRG